MNTSTIECQLMTDGHIYAIALKLDASKPTSRQIVDGLSPNNIKLS